MSVSVSMFAAVLVFVLCSFCEHYYYYIASVTLNGGFSRSVFIM